MESTPRKGSLRRADIPPAVLKQLNEGTLSTASLAEFLSIDFARLFKSLIPEVSAHNQRKLKSSLSSGVLTRMKVAGMVLHDTRGLEALPDLIAHPNDTLRGWACYLIGHAPGLTLRERLQLIQPLANDAHFNVREWALMPIRPHFIDHEAEAVQLLTPWTLSPERNIRRYAVEVTRPCGVWVVHLNQMKRTPELALPLLEPFKSAPEKYIQDSVANWLNDASKFQPEWVRSLCDAWLNGSPEAATVRICRRALRTLNKPKKGIA